MEFGCSYLPTEALLWYETCLRWFYSTWSYWPFTLFLRKMFTIEISCSQFFRNRKFENNSICSKYEQWPLNLAFKRNKFNCIKNGREKIRSEYIISGTEKFRTFLFSETRESKLEVRSVVFSLSISIIIMFGINTK